MVTIQVAERGRHERNEAWMLLSLRFFLLIPLNTLDADTGIVRVLLSLKTK